MLELESPWLLAVLPLPLILRWLLPPYAEQRESVRVPFFSRLVALSGREPGRGSVIAGRNWFQWLLAFMVWILIVAAAARPVWVEDPITKIESARDLMLLVDLSGSMDTRDFTDPDGKRINRLAAVKLVLDDFIDRREGDRIGLLVFGTEAFLQVPFTLDHEICRVLLDELDVAMAGPQTVIGDAIGLAVTVFEESEAEERVAILLTDGNDSGSKVPPDRAAAIAAKHGITIHTVAVGSPEAAGEYPLDIEAIEEIAETSGGRSFFADDLEQLEDIYRVLDEVAPEEVNTLSYRPRTALYQWPLGGALVLGWLLLVGAGIASRLAGRRVVDA